MTRVAVFVDYQNVYMGARKAFLPPMTRDYVFGQIFPRRLGVLLTDRGREHDAERQLESVSVYRGEPSPKHSAAGQAACQRQCRFWRSQAAVRVVTRPLKYYRVEGEKFGPPRYEAREKGIDVRIAIDMATGAMQDLFDVAVLFSADTDLLPALEAVRAAGKVCEVAAWQAPDQHSSRLRLPHLWCHWLTRDDYDRLADTQDYTLETAASPQSEP